jgi:hypothetical protein
MRGAIAVVAVTAGAVIAAVSAGLLQEGNHATGSNGLAPHAYVTVVGAGQRMCQAGEFVPPGSGFVELNVGTFGRPGPPLRVEVGDASAGAHRGGYRDGWVRVPFSGPAAGAAQPAAAPDVCLRNQGRSRIVLAGEATPPDGAARVAGAPSPGRVTLRWRAARATTWWADAATIAERATFGKADLGPWTPVLLLALVWAGAFALVLRSARA